MVTTAGMVRLAERRGVPDDARKVENLGCFYPIEVAQVGCILGRTITSRPQPEGKP
jgi:hypothetical protein